MLTGLLELAVHTNNDGFSWHSEGATLENLPKMNIYCMYRICSFRCCLLTSRRFLYEVDKKNHENLHTAALFLARRLCFISEVKKNSFQNKAIRISWQPNVVLYKITVLAQVPKNLYILLGVWPSRLYIVYGEKRFCFAVRKKFAFRRQPLTFVACNHWEHWSSYNPQGPKPPFMSVQLEKCVTNICHYNSMFSLQV